MTILWGRLLTSWTLWTNLVLLLLTISDYIAANLTAFPKVPPQYIALAGVVLNALLRILRTKDALIEKPTTPTIGVITQAKDGRATTTS